MTATQSLPLILDVLLQAGLVLGFCLAFVTPAWLAAAFVISYWARHDIELAVLDCIPRTGKISAPDLWMNVQFNIDRKITWKDFFAECKILEIRGVILISSSHWKEDVLYCIRTPKSTEWRVKHVEFYRRAAWPFLRGWERIHDPTGIN